MQGSKGGGNSPPATPQPKDDGGDDGEDKDAEVEQDESASAQVGSSKLDPLTVLHTGDLVLMRCKLSEDEQRGSAGNPATGYACVDCLDNCLHCVPVEGSFSDCGLDIRDFLFIVIEQLSYTAQKDLRRRRKYVEQELGSQAGGSAALVAELNEYEKRAKFEAKMNEEITNKRLAGLLKYGNIFQLQHVRSRKFVGVRPKYPAKLQRTARLVELQDGSVNCWIRANPAFVHKMQGEPILFDEQVSLESMKLGPSWNFGSACCNRPNGDMVHEVSCFKGDVGFFFVLYSRGTHMDMGSSRLALGMGSVIRLFHAEQCGYVTASCSKEKPNAYIRHVGSIAHQEQSSMCAKDLWVTELVDINRSASDCGIEYCHTPVLVRHFGSGRYLSVDKGALSEHDLLHEEDYATIIHLPSRRLKTALLGPAFQASTSMVSSGPSGIPENFKVTLSDAPGPSCVFTLEPTSTIRSDNPSIKLYVPRDKATVMLRWVGGPTGQHPLWLSCTGAQKGKRRSLELSWTAQRFPHNALQVQLSDNDAGLWECDAIVQRRQLLEERLIPQVTSSRSSQTLELVCAEVDMAASDMIHFLGDSILWQAKDDGKRRNTKAHNAMNVPWVANKQRQRFVRQLMYVDMAVDLFNQLLVHSPEFADGANIFQSAVAWSSDGAGTPITPGMTPATTPAESDHERLAGKMRMRCLKVVIRLWLFCFLGLRENENYFHKRGWMDSIDGMNGQGLGASDVFVALIGNNSNLVRCVTSNTVQRFINFIRELGPLDTWLSFFKALCAPQGQAVPSRQQELLMRLIFQGHLASEAERAATLTNRRELLVWVRLDDALGVPLGRPSPGFGPPWEGCLGHGPLTRGVHDIAVSWAHPDHWEVGRGVLFHGPKALGLPRLGGAGGRSWVSLAQLMWVLQPKRCCEAVTGKAWEPSEEMESLTPGTSRVSHPESRKLGLQTLIANYFLAQLHLLVNLVKSRQMNCIMALQEEYSFSLCLCGARDARLPTSVRGAFFELLAHLWLNRHPHSEVRMPSLFRPLPNPRDPAADDLTWRVVGEVEVPETWSEEHLRALPQEVHSFYSFHPPAKLEAVIQVLRSHLCAGPEVEQQVHSAKDDNAMMLSVLCCLQFLLRFGFFHSRELLGEFLGPVLRCLDGRTDWLDPIAPASRPDGRLAQEEEVQQNEITPLLQQRGGSRRLGKEKATSASNSGQLPRASGDQLTRARFPPMRGSTGRYTDDESNKGVIAAKVQMVQVIMSILQIGVDLKLSKLVKCFEQKGGTSAFVDIVLEVIDDPVLAFQQPGVQNPNAMLLDLLMYKDPTLFSLVLELLLIHCSWTSDFLGYCDRIRLLDRDQAELASSLRSEIHRLGKLVHSFQTWGVDDEFSNADPEKARELKAINKRVRLLCTQGVGSATNREAQDMLRQTEFFAHVNFVLNLVSDDFKASSRQMLQEMIATLCMSATYALRGNPKNQDLIFGSIARAEELADWMPQCAVLLTEVFRGNFELCQQVPESMVQHFGTLVVRERLAGNFRPWYLGFLSAICTVGFVPVPRNQRLVFEIFQKLKPERMLCLNEPTASRLQSLAASFRSESQMLEPDPSTWIEADGELIYYFCSVELLTALGLGQGSEALTNKPIVNQIYPAAEVIRLLLQVQHPSKTHVGFSINCHLRTQWLRFLHEMVYDVEASLFNEELMGSLVHLNFFQQVVIWLEDTMDLVPEDEVRPQDPALDAGAEAYLVALLSCVDAFFQRTFSMVKNSELCHSLTAVALELPRRFTRIVQPSPGRFVPRRRLSDQDYLSTIALRVLSAAGTRVQNTAWTTSANTPQGQQQRVTPTSEAQAKWEDSLAALRADARIRDRIDREARSLGRTFLDIEKHTDPETAEYVKVLPCDPSGVLPPGVDFRRTRISVEDILTRIVQHCRGPLFGGYATLRRVLRLCLAMIKVARSREGMAGPNLQVMFVQTGVAELVVQVLDANIAQDTEASSWELLAEILHSPGKHGSRRLQNGLYSALRGMDDTGVWESFQDLTDAVGSLVKPMRSLQRLPSLTVSERQQLEEYRVQVTDLCTALSVFRLMAEGHYADMQDYLFSQIGNSRSVNVLATTVWVFSRLCKDSTDADRADELEFECLSLLLELMTEVTQGPNLRNQEFVSTLGLIEGVCKLLAAGFAHLQRASGDLYPPRVQRLKAQMLETLLALLEGRMDTTIHTTMAQRFDCVVLRQRIRFVYCYFVFGAVGVSSGEVQSEGHAAIPLHGRIQPLLLPSVDPSELLEELEPASLVAEELLEDLDDEELDTLFSEGLDCVQVCLELSPVSTQFSAEVMPVDGRDEKFVDTPNHYASRNDYIRELRAFRERKIYRMSFSFLQRFVHTIEVNLRDQLQNLHFQQPLTAMWYCSSASKQRILDTVPLSSLDAKTKAFIKMCEEVHLECRLIRQLSRFSVLPDRHRKWAQRNLPDGLHRPFQSFLANDARRMQLLLVFSLFLSVLIALQVGLQLVHVPASKRTPGGPRVAWVSDTAANSSHVVAGLYFAVTLLWVGLTASLKVPLSMQTCEWNPHHQILSAAKAVGHFCVDPYQMWRCLLLIFCGWGLFGGHPWLYSFLITDCFCQNSKLATVLSGIVAPAHSWLMTFLGMAIVTFTYAAVGFQCFHEEFGDYCSENILVCTANILYQGSRSGVIGLSHMMEQVSTGDVEWPSRFLYDVSYFIIFGVMLLNAVVALVVDSFSTQRRAAENRQKLLMTESFISGLNRKVIDTAAQNAGMSDGFDYHEQNLQNKWDYMSFIFHVREKSEEDYTGPEQDIAKMLEANDVQWLPLGKSKILSGNYNDRDSIPRIQKQLDTVEREMRNVMDSRKSLFASFGAMGNFLSDKVSFIEGEAANVLSAVEESRKKPNMAAFVHDMRGYGPAAGSPRAAATPGSLRIRSPSQISVSRVSSRPEVLTGGGGK